MSARPVAVIGHVINGAGALQRRHITVTEIILEALRIIRINPDDVHDAGGFGILRAVIQPDAGKLERRTEAGVETHDFSIKAARRLDIQRADRIVIKPADGHAPLPGLLPRLTAGARTPKA